jgi:hypothetical protein
MQKYSSPPLPVDEGYQKPDYLQAMYSSLQDIALPQELVHEPVHQSITKL